MNCKELEKMMALLTLLPILDRAERTARKFATLIARRHF
jgi:hypothetical protein